MKKVYELNFKLLAIFDAIMRNLSISQAAKELGISQSSLSNQLAKLRITLDNKLFVRTGHGVLPTVFSESLHPYVLNAMDIMRVGIQASDEFDLSKVERTFTIIMTDIGEVTLLPQLIKKIGEVAPSIHLRTINLPPASVSDALKGGQADIAVAYIPDSKPSFIQRLLFETDYICIVKRGHKFTKNGFSKTDFEQAKHLVVEAEGTGHDYLLEKIYAENNISRNDVVRVPNFMSMPHIIAGSNLIATIPRKAAYAFHNIPNICIVEHPLPLPTIDIKALWHERYNCDKTHMWFREQLYEIARNLKWDEIFKQLEP